MILQYADIDDAVLLTQQKLVKRGAFLDLQHDLQDHVAVREMWKTKKKVFDGGDDWEWEAQIDHNHSARWVGLFETDGSALTDTMIRGRVQPRHVNASYIYDQREKAFQRGGVKIADLVFSRYVGMMGSFFELLEEALWSKPESSSDTTTPFGVDYWVIKCSGSDGWESTNPSGFTDGRGGIDSTTYTRWSNWAALYTAISQEDLIRKMREGHTKTKFVSPVQHAQPSLGGSRNGIYTNYTVLGYLEEELTKQNMNLGNDIASKDGKVNFRSTPITWVPYLDNDSTDPLYMLDWKWLAIGVLSGWENNLSAPYRPGDKHLVRRVDLDATMQMICTNLRRQAVFSTSA